MHYHVIGQTAKLVSWTYGGGFTILSDQRYGVCARHDCMGFLLQSIGMRVRYGCEGPEEEQGVWFGFAGGTLPVLPLR